MISIFLLVFSYIVAIGFGLRIYFYYKTGNEKYKHNYDCWEQHGKHERGATKRG